MNDKRRDVAAQLLTQLDAPATELCNCLPLSSLETGQAEQAEDTQEVSLQEQKGMAAGSENTEKGTMWTPATPALNTWLRQQLGDHFPRSAPLSILLLHVSQLEHIQSIPQSAILNKRQRFHASSSFLEQVLVNVRRAIRGNDQMLIHAGTGAAVIFPGVDQQGVHIILERIYRNISLLQAETVIPPLKHETDIVIGVSSYPEAGPSIEHLLYQVSITARRFTLRPVITAHLLERERIESLPVQGQVHALPAVRLLETHSRLPADNKESRRGTPTASFAEDSNDVASDAVGTSPAVAVTRLIASHTPEHTGRTSNTIPFMQLPAQLPTRLKHLIPHHVALELRCAPVGRDHHCLTVALADPTNSNMIRFLGELTGLTIFPVSCELTALNALLANKW